MGRIHINDNIGIKSNMYTEEKKGIKSHLEIISDFVKQLNEGFLDSDNEFIRNETEKEITPMRGVKNKSQKHGCVISVAQKQER